MHPTFERRPKREQAYLLRRLRGEKVSVVDQPSTSAARAFATAIISTMVLTTAVLLFSPL